MENITAVIVNWLTARNTAGAVQSFQTYYPNIPILIVDDGSDPKDKTEFMQVYRDAADALYDFETTLLKKFPNSTYIQVPTHRRHGESVDYALPEIKTKWMFLMDSDVRLVNPGIIEYMMDEVDDTICGIGIHKEQMAGYPKIANYVGLFRADLAQKYKDEGAIFAPIYELRLETNTRYFKVLTEKGYKIKYCNIKDYFVHLRIENKDEWQRYF